MSRPGARLTLLLTAALLSCAAVPAAAHAEILGRSGDAIRLTQAGPDDSLRSHGLLPAAARDPATGRILVVYARGEAWGPGDSQIKYEIHGRFFGPDLAPLGPEQKISTTPGGHDHDALSPDVAFNPARGEWLVAWRGYVSAGTEEEEIFAHRLTATGVLAAGPEVRLSHVGADGDGDPRPYAPRLAVHPTRGEALVVWEAGNEGPAFGLKRSAVGQRIDGNLAPLGAPLTLGAVGAASDDATGVEQPEVVFHPRTGRYVVAYAARVGVTGTYAFAEYKSEVFGIPVSADGAVGPSATRWSQTALDGSRTGVGRPALAVDGAGELLVTWSTAPGAGALPTDKYEVFGQRVRGSDLTELGGATDRQLTSTAPAGTAQRSAIEPAIAPLRGGAAVLASADPEPLANDELEAFVQHVGEDLTPRLPGVGVRASAVGPDGVTETRISGAELLPLAEDRVLALWSGPPATPGAVPRKRDVFAQLLTLQPDPPPPAPPGTPTPAPPAGPAPALPKLPVIAPGKVAVDRKAVKLTRTAVTLKLTCGARGPVCVGDVVVRDRSTKRQLGSRGFTIPVGRSRTVQVTIRSDRRRLLRVGKTRRIAVEIATRSGKEVARATTNLRLKVVRR